MTFTTRFAPSPTGPLHLGHAFSAMLAYDMAVQNGGTFLLRIEDIDRQRAKPAWEQQIYDDLHWLGLTWPTPVMRQSERQPAYDAALDALWHRGLLYPCTCNRRDIAQAAAAPQEGAPLIGPDGVVYPGTCRQKPRPSKRPIDCALRLDTGKAASVLPRTFHEDLHHKGEITVSDHDIISKIGDVVLARRDMGTSYHLSVVLDDAEQNITDVVRGEDLFDATAIHVLLQALFDLPTPRYHHHRLIRDDAGKRLAKRDDARAIAKYRADGASAQDIRALLDLN